MGCNSKAISAILILANLAMFAFISTHAACPSLDVCANVAGLLVKAQIGASDPRATPCCSLLGDLAAADVQLCLCNPLKQSPLGSDLTTALGLTNGLPIIGGGGLGGLVGGIPVVGPLLDGLLGGLLGGTSSVVYSLTSTVLNADVTALVNACGYVDPNKYKCDA